MGKKKILAQSEQDILKDEQKMAAAQKKAALGAQSLKAKKIDKGKVFIRSSYNNTFITVTDTMGGVLAWASAGSLGFRGPKKATPFAASKIVESIIEKIKKTGIKEVMIFATGIGSGREAAIRAFASHGLDIVSIKDITPIPHNGCRPPKPRRV